MNFKKNYIYYINAILCVAIIVLDLFYMNVFKLGTNNIYTKSVTSALFVILGAINLIYALKHKTSNTKFSIIILVGLFFAMLGDILLEINFMIGAIFFAIGHIFFFVSYCFILSFKLTDCLYGLGIIVPAVLLITLAPWFNFGGFVMELLCIVYAVVISFMLGKAIANLVRSQTKLNIVLALGSFLFFFSDLMLLFNVFGSGARVFGVLCLSTYYPAETLLAFSILVCFMLATSKLEAKQVRAENNEEAKEIKTEEPKEVKQESIAEQKPNVSAKPKQEKAEPKTSKKPSTSKSAKTTSSKSASAKKEPKKANK